jgi:hypothetical protein
MFMKTRKPSSILVFERFLDSPSQTRPPRSAEGLLVIDTSGVLSWLRNVCVIPV